MDIPNTEYINKNEKVLHSIKRTLKVLVAVTIGLCIGLGTLSVLTFNQANKNTAALCAFKDDLQKRIDSSTSFLLTHPKGFSGVSAQTIQQSIVNEQRTVYSLRELNC